MYSLIGKEDGGSAFSRGRPASIRVVFINLSGARRREGKALENRASLTWPYACVLPAASSHEGRTTPSRCLPLMKTTQFLAGPLEICAHPGSGGARDKSPDPYCRTAPNVYWAERDKESGLTSITVPLTVTSMEASAFQGCTSLESAVIQAPLPTLPSRSLYKCDVRERGCSGGGRVRRA